MSYVDSMKVILKSRDAATDYKERTRQQVIHLAWTGDLQAQELVGEQKGKHCPCTNCHYQHMLDGVRAETYK